MACVCVSTPTGQKLAAVDHFYFESCALKPSPAFKLVNCQDQSVKGGPRVKGVEDRSRWGLGGGGVTCNRPPGL